MDKIKEAGDVIIKEVVGGNSEAKCLWNISDEECVRKWKAGEVLHSLELGGLGPGYEQAMQEAVFDMFSWLIDNKVQPDACQKGSGPSRYYVEEFKNVTAHLGLSGVQENSTMLVAFRFLKLGYAAVMDDVQNHNKDRMIMVSRTMRNKMETLLGFIGTEYLQGELPLEVQEVYGEEVNHTRI